MPGSTSPVALAASRKRGPDGGGDANPFKRFNFQSPGEPQGGSTSSGAGDDLAAMPETRKTVGLGGKPVRDDCGHGSRSAPISAQAPAQLREKYCTPGRPERPLRLLLVGHNPSDHAWRSGHYYSNPSNRMWYLLSSTGIVPGHFKAVNDDDCPWEAGVGFTDLGSGNPGTKSGSFKGDLLRGTWRFDLYQRLQAHTERAGAPPKVIAFTGKRQFQHLFDGNQKVDYGLQTIRPPGWPFRPEQCKVFVLTSSSGASALTNEQREAPYRDLAALLAELPPWQPLDELKK